MYLHVSLAMPYAGPVTRVGLIGATTLGRRHADWEPAYFLNGLEDLEILHQCHVMMLELPVKLFRCHYMFLYFVFIHKFIWPFNRLGGKKLNS